MLDRTKCYFHCRCFEEILSVRPSNVFERAGEMFFSWTQSRMDTSVSRKSRQLPRLFASQCVQANDASSPRRFFIPAFRVFLYHDSISPTSYAFLLFPLRPFIVIATYFRLLTVARFYPPVFLSPSRFKHFLEKRYCLAMYCIVRNVDSCETRQNSLRIFCCSFFLIISITGHRKTTLNSINF